MSNPNLRGQSCSKPEDVPHDTASKRVRLVLLCCHGQCEAGLVLACETKTDSCSWPGTFLVDSRGVPGGRSLSTERTFPQKRLSSTTYSPPSNLCTGSCFPSHPGILSGPVSLKFPRKPRFLLKHQAKRIKTWFTSCFFPFCKFQNTSLKGATTVVPPLLSANGEISQLLTQN